MLILLGCAFLDYQPAALGGPYPAQHTQARCPPSYSAERKLPVLSVSFFAVVSSTENGAMVQKSFSPY